MNVGQLITELQKYQPESGVGTPGLFSVHPINFVTAGPSNWHNPATGQMEPCFLVVLSERNILRKPDSSPSDPEVGSTPVLDDKEAASGHTEAGKGDL